MTHMLVSFLFLLFTAWSAVIALGATRDEAVNTALKNNPELQALRYEEEVAKAQLQKAKLPLPANPVVGGSLSKKDRPAGDTGSGKYTNYGITLSQEFEIGGQRGLRIDLAQKNLSKVGFLIKDRERVLTYEVKDAFARALSLGKRAELAGKVVGLQGELLDFTRIKYKAGSVSGLEVNLAEVELGKARRDLLTVERELKEALVMLQGLMGMRPEASFMVRGELSPETYVLPDKETLKERAAMTRPDLKASVAEVDISGTAVDLAKRQAIPNVTFGGFQARDQEQFDRGVLMSVSIPLFDRKQAERKTAEARAFQARIARSGAEKGLLREIEGTYNNLVLTLEELAVFKKDIINKSIETLNLLNFAFKEGKVSFFEVRTAQKDTLEMQFAYLDTVLQAERWIYAIERATGGTAR